MKTGPHTPIISVQSCFCHRVSLFAPPCKRAGPFFVVRTAAPGRAGVRRRSRPGRCSRWGRRAGRRRGFRRGSRRRSRSRPRPSRGSSRLRASGLVAVDLQVRLDKCAEQPGPDGSLMVRAVARGLVAGAVMRAGSRASRARASAGRRASAECSATWSTTPARLVALNDGERQADGEDLVGAHRARPGGRPGR